MWQTRTERKKEREIERGDLEFGKRNDITVLRSMPGGLLRQCVVVVEA